MANKKLNKISIKPMNNAAAIASTLGIITSPKNVEQQSQKNVEPQLNAETTPQKKQPPLQPQTAVSINKKTNKFKDENETKIMGKKGIEETEAAKITPQLAHPTSQTFNQMPEMPLLIDIRKKFPGKELFILSLLYLHKNNRGLVQMTVNGMMALYNTAFQDVIKDDTVRRSLKRLSDGGFIKTTSIPGDNSGYIYEIRNLLETENLNQSEKEEFAELTRFVQEKLNPQSS
jgi:hypothetical protein